jgi:hypothetical protein
LSTHQLSRLLIPHSLVMAVKIKFLPAISIQSLSIFYHDLP